MGTLPELASSEKPITDAAQLFMGSSGAILITVGAVISIGGTLNAVMLIGSRVNGTGNFPGTIDDVKIWKTTRTASQIKQDSQRLTGLSWAFVDLQPT